MRLRDVYNPATTVDSELYGRYILPEQPLKSSLALGDVEAAAEPLMTGALYGHSLLHGLGLYAHGTDLQSFSFDGPDLKLWTSAVRAALAEDPSEEPPDDHVAYQRGRPAWLYYRSEALGLSVIRSPVLSNIIRYMAKEAASLGVALPSVNGDLHILDGVNNYVSRASAHGVLAILNDIEERSSTPALIPCPVAALLPLEDTLIASAGDHVLVLEDETGRLFYDRERLRLLERHAREAQLLFPSRAFYWPQPTNPARFEELIRELLEREAGVLFVRKAGPTNDRDAGRDLIIDWVLAPMSEKQLRPGVSPWERLRVVGQCKAATTGKSVGSHRVVDVLDTIERHSANGYLLAASTELSSSVVDKLDTYRRQGRHYIEWWTRIEIEQRLRLHRDIAERYRDLVDYH